VIQYPNAVESPRSIGVFLERAFVLGGELSTQPTKHGGG
jgi:hypothetical protein